ncbi:hypothetical protein DID78_01050 [Candidatus Marinamargulisbacteria bacterium SCGC AG-343-D04]|nr:hypothetical protein DID78_01050 [Candidatus Marinamargulisbacteria bacterium SCGC AG-343-D04]
MSSIDVSISKSISTLNSNLFSNQQFVNELLKTLTQVFENCSINIYLTNTHTKKIENTVSNHDLWPIPFYEIKLLNSAYNKNSKKKNLAYYISNRKKFILTNFKQLKQDQEKFQYSCNDGLFLKLENKSSLSYGIIFIHSWKNKNKLSSHIDDINKYKDISLNYISKAINILENYTLHSKINNLITNQNKLKVKLHKDEINLKKRVLELTSLYETSNELSQSLNHNEIIKKVLHSLNKVLNLNFCSIFSYNLYKTNDIYISSPKKAPKSIQNKIVNQTLEIMESFIFSKISKNEVKKSIIHIDNYHIPITAKEINIHTNIPLIFRGELLGVICIFSAEHQQLNDNQNFINTISNQLASSLGKIKIIKNLEKSKIISLLENISDPIIFIDEHTNHHIINTEAEKSLHLNNINEKKLNKELPIILYNLGLYNLYQTVSKTKKAVTNLNIQFNNHFFSVNISPLINETSQFLGTLITFKDITKIKKMERIKTQRLNAISKINLFIKSIKNTNHLLEVLIDYFLSISNCNMGSIQLFKDKSFITFAHSNFPEKVRQTYRFKNGISISEKTQKTKKMLIIDNYFNNKNINPNVKILIETYICIPLLYNDNLIGIINLVKKFGANSIEITKEDKETLTTVTALASTIVQNAIFYKENLEKEKLDQELKVAKEIQNSLLPKKIPEKEKLMISLLNSPARKIGGDFYDFIEMKNNKLGIIIADIVGKGVPAGLYMATLKSILTRNNHHNTSPKKTLYKLNNIIYHDPVINKFIPLFYGIFDLDKHSFTYSNAGHEGGFIFRKNKFISLDTKGFPLGGYKNENYEEKTIKINNDDLLTFFTDGLIEIRNEKNKLFGIQGLQSFIKKHHKFPTNIIIKKLNNVITSFTSNSSHIDDITAIICKFNKKFEKNHEIIFRDEFSTKSTFKNIKETRKKITDLCKKTNLDHKAILDIQLAISEAQVNIIEHAYLGNETKKITFIFTEYNDKIKITIKDQGLKMNKHYISKKNTNINEIEGSGLGLYLINTLMDEIEHKTTKEETLLILTKYKT